MVVADCRYVESGGRSQLHAGDDADTSTQTGRTLNQ
jgi:hypothetical protein